MSARDLDLLSITCPRCEALAGEPCVSRTGRRATYPHAARTRPVYAAYSAGYQDAQDDLLSDPAWYERERARWLKRQGVVTAIEGAVR